MTSECGLVISIIKTELVVGHGLQKAKNKVMKISSGLYELK